MRPERTGDGYAVVSLDDVEWGSSPGGPRRVSLTAALGATELTVDACRFASGDAYSLPANPEQLHVPLDAAEPVDVEGIGAVRVGGLARVPAGVAGTVRGAGPATVLLVGAPVDPTPDAAPVGVATDEMAFSVPATSAVATAFLTPVLGCAGMKVNVRRLEPGQAVPSHMEGDQEELFVPVAGPASMLIAGERHPTPIGTLARVAPAVPRGAVNDGADTAVWVMVGAPPTGGPTGWDPGAEILE